MKRYPVQLEIAGPTAMWTRPDTGDCPVSYPVLTCLSNRGCGQSGLREQALERESIASCIEIGHAIAPMG